MRHGVWSRDKGIILPWYARPGHLLQSITSFLIIYNYDSVGSDLVGCVAEPEWTDGTDEDAIKKQTLYSITVLNSRLAYSLPP